MIWDQEIDLGKFLAPWGGTRCARAHASHMPQAGSYCIKRGVSAAWLVLAPVRMHACTSALATPLRRCLVRTPMLYRYARYGTVLGNGAGSSASGCIIDMLTCRAAPGAAGMMQGERSH